jgi:ABC-2 type transport system permease protein
MVAWDKQEKTRADIQAAVAAGEYQVAIIIPEGSTRKVQKETALLFQENREHASPAAYIPVLIFFDPGVMPGFRSGLTAQLQMALETIALEAKIRILGREIHNLLESLGVTQDFAPLSAARLSELTRQPLFVLQDSDDSSSPTPQVPQYNPVQQNVPAWAIFGIFFTAIPIAGAILQERKSGIWIRLASLPVSHLLLFSGKVIAYLGVCFCQFMLIGLIGTFLFPFIGLPAFSVSGNPEAVLAAVFCSSLAACGFGIFLGMACGTYEQASALGATAVVAAAAIGGVMVPVYAMPGVMQDLSIISPLNWGLTAFHDLLVRGYSFSVIWDDLGRLVLFFFLTIFLAWRLARPRI